MSKLSAMAKPNPGDRIEVLPHVGTLRLSGTSSQITSRSAITRHFGTTSCEALFNDFISRTQISADHQLLVIVHNNIMRGLISNTQFTREAFRIYVKMNPSRSFISLLPSCQYDAWNHYRMTCGLWRPSKVFHITLW
ncbi:hypothetical protein OIDMADRAFT_184253 [Oidiodendron maius Zn]|uniref:Uncharacterized protein n=1 Tax=Oidiodendron maius (strain Zn) TaxID=913774 RepID=A0A0C3GEH8_OIDMZ|nr:hypothetical protein OIDMADRAFT_184253 [Oidiodendron maius Zn]